MSVKVPVDRSGADGPTGLFRGRGPELGVKITERQIPTLTSSDKAEVEQYYDTLKGTYEDMIKQDGIDAFLLNTDMIKDEKRIKIGKSFSFILAV